MELAAWELAERVRRGETRAIARLITLAENRHPAGQEALAALHRWTGRAYVVGVTGPPGSGKSTLAYQLAKKARLRGRKVGIIAVDPTSPFTGGALLGDRVRMSELATDPGVFIRSLATRASSGGLSRATREAVGVLDAAGYDLILVETVGVGQSEVNVARIAGTTLVVLVPGLGDDIQAFKAGLMEVADIFVVNKADREGAARLVAEIQLMLDTKPTPDSWTPPVLETVATSGQGVDKLWEEIERHRAFLRESGRLQSKRRDRLQEEILTRAKEELATKVEALAQRDDFFSPLLKKAEAGEWAPQEVAARILEEVLGGNGASSHCPRQ